MQDFKLFTKKVYTVFQTAIKNQQLNTANNYFMSYTKKIKSAVNRMNTGYQHFSL